LNVDAEFINQLGHSEAARKAALHNGRSDSRNPEGFGHGSSK
jgi:hypothetical protein